MGRREAEIRHSRLSRRTSTSLPEKKISLGYDDRGTPWCGPPMATKRGRAAPSDPDEAYKKASVVLINNP